VHSQSCSVLLKELARVRCLPRFLSVQVWSCCAFKKLFRCVLQLQLLVRSHKFRGTSRAAFAHYRSCSDVHQVQLSSAAPSVLWFLSVCSSAAEDAATAPLSCSVVVSLDGPASSTHPSTHPLMACRFLSTELSTGSSVGIFNPRYSRPLSALAVKLSTGYRGRPSYRVRTKVVQQTL
jgi:hypothetical protein